MQAQYGHKKTGNASWWPWLVLCAGLLWAFSVFFWTTARIGAVYGYAPALGDPLHFGSLVGYSPLTVWNWPKVIWVTPAVELILQRGMLIFTGPPMLLFLLVMA